jgi:redox-sensitive bicupin YhaK (pirin superfamily)
MSPPRYQNILNSQIPTTNLPDGQGSVRVIAGEFGGLAGPARTFTPIHVWDLRLTSEQPLNLPVPEGYTTLLAVLKGSVRINNSETINAAEVGLFDRAGDHICIDSAHATVLLLCGEPIDEPIVGSGPFVMNNTEEIRQAIADYQSGKMGHMA